LNNKTKSLNSSQTEEELEDQSEAIEESNSDNVPNIIKVCKGNYFIKIKFLKRLFLKDS
jgi:hypothetical protein